MDVEALAWAWGRLALAVVCVAALIAARWHHERQLAAEGRGRREIGEWLEQRPATARAGQGGGGILEVFVRRIPNVSYPLYWMGLTTSAALAAQSVSVLVLLQWG